MLSGNENIQVNPIATTSYRRKTTSRGICEVISNVITVTVHSAIPNAVAGSNAEVCNATSYQLAGNDPGAGFTGTWTAVSGGNVTFSPNADAYNATATGLIPGNVYVFKWTITNTLCTPKTSEVTVSNLLPLTNTIKCRNYRNLFRPSNFNSGFFTFRRK